MNFLKNKTNEPSNKKIKRLNSGAIGSICAGQVVTLLNSEELSEGDFTRCTILNPGGSYWRDARFLDIPKINLQKIINGKSISGPIRPIGEDMRQTGGDVYPGVASSNLKVDSYDPNNHTIHIVGNHGANFTVEIPVIFSSKDEQSISTDKTIKNIRTNQ